MLAGTTRDPDEVVVLAPPDLVECTVEKVAINAVMAGCRPEYLPVVLAALEAACTDEFNMHGLLATTWFSGPVVVVNGPITRAIGMNNGINALGPGNRANATIGRALQLVIRNVGGGRPGEIDRATIGQPGKFTCCFAEHEDAVRGSRCTSSAATAPSQNTVTLFAGEGIRGVVDQLSRTPESLTRTFARCLRTTAHPKLPLAFDAMLVISPEHLRVYAEAGWSKARFRDELGALLQLDGHDLVRGADGIEEGVPGGPRRRDAAEVPGRRSAHRAHRRRRRPVLGHHRRLGEWEDGLGTRHLGGADMTTLLDPTGERSPVTRARDAAARRRSTASPIGLLDITKARGDVFLDRVATTLEARGHTVVRFAKPTFTKPAPIDLRHEITTTCDVVIEALAD